MFMATLGGVTGTTAILPILLIFFQMELHIAVAHTSLFTFVSTSGRLLYDILTTLKTPEKRTINFQVVIIAAPVIFIASYIGVELELVSSPLLILFVMTVILSYSSFVSFKQYRNKRQYEREKDDAWADTNLIEADYGRLSDEIVIDNTNFHKPSERWTDDEVDFKVTESYKYKKGEKEKQDAKVDDPLRAYA